MDKYFKLATLFFYLALSGMALSAVWRLNSGCRPFALSFCLGVDLIAGIGGEGLETSVEINLSR